MLTAFTASNLLEYRAFEQLYNGSHSKQWKLKAEQNARDVHWGVEATVYPLWDQIIVWNKWNFANIWTEQCKNDEWSIKQTQKQLKFANQLSVEANYNAGLSFKQSTVKIELSTANVETEQWTDPLFEQRTIVQLKIMKHQE